MKIIFVVIVQLSTLAGLLSIPCGYKHPQTAKDSWHRKYDAWQCPNDDLCIQKQDVCAFPPFNIQRCPNGGDIGNDSCTEDLCKEIGFVKCPFDPYCVLGDVYACIGNVEDMHCPHGAKHADYCALLANDTHLASCGSPNIK